MSRPRDPFLAVSAVIAILVLAFVTMPLVITCFTAFNATSQTVFPPNGWSLRWFANMFEHARFGEAFRLSLALAVSTCVLTLAIGVAAAVAITRYRFFGRSLVDGIIMSPLIVPQVIIGLSFLLFYVSTGGRKPFIYLLALHLILTLPYAVRVLLASLSRLGGELEDAAIGLGASRLKAFLLITLPQMRAGLFAAAFFAFVISFDNFTATAFLIHNEATLPVEIYGYIMSDFDPTISAIATLMIIGTAAFVLLVDRTIGINKVT